MCRFCLVAQGGSVSNGAIPSSVFEHRNIFHNKLLCDMICFEAPICENLVLRQFFAFQHLCLMSASPNLVEDEQDGSFELSCHSLSISSNGSAHRSQTLQCQRIQHLFDMYVQ